ncbi:MAG: hypothetical protein O7C56_03990, partial [Rickettsia endosymbiont of Ixodes persulcatus]|nr:hypothetical protein [Rickettsia endosymbiont of Ixodes persulcatus]
KVVATSVDTLLVLNLESGELADIFGPLSNHLGVVAPIVSWFVGQHRVQHGRYFPNVYQLEI